MNVSRFNKSIATILLLSLFSGPFSFADETVKISSGTLVFLGSISTSTGTSKDSWSTIGFILIFVGLFSGSRDANAEVITPKTEISLFSGEKDHQTLQNKVSVGPVLQKIEMDSLVAAYDPQLAKALPMSEISSQYNMDSQRVGQLLVTAKRVGDQVLNGQEFGSKVVKLDRTVVVSRFGNLSEQETHIVTNYFRLRNLTL